MYDLLYNPASKLAENMKEESTDGIAIKEKVFLKVNILIKIARHRVPALR